MPASAENLFKGENLTPEQIPDPRLKQVLTWTREGLAKRYGKTSPIPEAFCFYDFQGGMGKFIGVVLVGSQSNIDELEHVPTADQKDEKFILFGNDTNGKTTDIEIHIDPQGLFKSDRPEHIGNYGIRSLFSKQGGRLITVKPVIDVETNLTIEQVSQTHNMLIIVQTDAMVKSLGENFDNPHCFPIFAYMPSPNEPLLPS